MAKVKIGDLLKGAGTSWLQIGKQLTADQQNAAARQPNPQMPTRTRGGGITEGQRSKRETLARTGGSLTYDEIKNGNNGYHGDVYKLPNAKDKSWTWQQAEEGMKRFNGNVDLYNRPVVGADAMARAGYNIPAGNTATVYSMQRGIKDKDGNIREVLYTPITANGEVLSQKDIDAYIDSLDGSDDILAADKARKGMIIHLDADPSGNDGQELHLMQEAYGQKPMRTIDRHARTVVAGGGEGGSATAARGTGAVTPVSGYDDILKMMRHDALAEGDMARRQHNREVMTGLGDLVSSIANLWSTTKGGPNGYDNSKGMTATVQARYANDLARRRAQQEQILNYYRVKKAAEDDARVRKYREDQDAREQRRLDENERHNRELEKIAAGKAETDKENKERAAAEKERSNKAKETEQTRHNQATENKKSQGRSGGNKSNSRRSRGSANNNTPPGRRQGNTNNNNVRPSQRK